LENFECLVLNEKKTENEDHKPPCLPRQSQSEPDKPGKPAGREKLFLTHTLTLVHQRVLTGLHENFNFWDEVKK